MTLPHIEPYPLPGRRCLDDNRLRWQAEPARAALLIHDMQNYFLRPYSEGAPAGQAISHIHHLAATARDAGVPVLYSRQPPDQTPHQRGLLADLWGAGPGAAPDDADITAALTPHPGDHIVTKHRYSAFHATDLAAHLHRAGRDQLIVTGVYAHLGCLLTCTDAFMQGIQPFLIADATADFDAPHHTWALRYAATRCAVVTLTADISRALTGAHRPAPGAHRTVPCPHTPPAPHGPKRANATTVKEEPPLSHLASKEHHDPHQ
ncbi:isochorismatase family protein [Streptomyces sp. NPDC091268]|uniref:isochorismatase family protein n=1 Tax=Streptomyces sp. NPDC091268 TaxID=3365979 RepID=UPI0037FD5EC4